MRLASIFTSHMVLQANMPVKIFGEGKGIVKVEFLGEIYEYISYEENWCMTLDSYEYGGPYNMIISLDRKEITLSDIYIGEVWLAMGQSNMEMPLFRTEYGFEEARHSKNNKIRFFTVPRRVEKDTEICGWSFEKTDGKDTPWQLCSEQTSLHFSAIGYYAAKGLQKDLGVAVGIVSCNYGGQKIESFIKRDFFEKHHSLKVKLNEYENMISNMNYDSYEAEYRKGIQKWQEFYNSIDYDEVEQVKKMGVRATSAIPANLPQMPEGLYSAQTAGCLFDSMISRIIPFAAKGVLWYQGESNSCYNYADKYMIFMDCMRECFENKEMPFYAVELASVIDYWNEEPQNGDDRYAEGDNWAFKRQEQYKAAAQANDNYIVTSMELGDLYNIHPVNKKELANRLIKKILKYTYGKEVMAEQPVFKNAVFGEKYVRVDLEYADGIFSPDLSGVKMYISDSSKTLKRAVIKIEGNTLLLSNPEVNNPEVVSYAFDFYYLGSHIYNSAGLPLAPFRAEKEKNFNKTII